MRGRRRGGAAHLLEALDRGDPHDGGAEVTLDALLHGGGDHLELEQLVELVGRHLGLVALPVAGLGAPS